MRTSMLSVLALLSAVVLAGDETKTIEELITQHGFVFEGIPVRTPDGYICQMHRFHRAEGAKKGPVLLQHGLFDSSDAWVVNYRDRALGFILADEGFDVFMGNSRGNKYCLEHEKFESTQSEFWDFSWDEMAAHDLPAYVDTVLGITSASKLSYVGHSQGTTQMFAALVSQPEITEKVELFAALAPVTYIAHTESPLIQAAAKMRVDQLVASLGVQQLLPNSQFMESVMPWFCTNSFFSWMCDSVLHFMIGYNKEEMQQDRMSVYLSHFPSGTSTKDLIHWAQGVRSFSGGEDKSDFRQFDYGSDGNMKRYGSETPPLYDLSKFPHQTTHLMVFSGGVDKVANPTDVDRMIADLPTRPFWNVFEGYDHLDFMWGQNAHQDVFPAIVQQLNERWTAKSLAATSKSGSSDGWTGTFSFTSAMVVCAAMFATVSASVVAFVVVRKRRIQKIPLVQKQDLEQTLLV